MSEIVSMLLEDIQETKRVSTNFMVDLGFLHENRRRQSDSEFYAEHGVTKQEYEEKYGKGAVYVASMPPEVRESELAKARAEQQRQDEAQMEQLTQEQREEEARVKEEQAYKARGNRTQEEYDEHMAQSKAEYYASKEHVKTYRGVDIYKDPDTGSYMAEVNNKGLATNDLPYMEHLIDAELDGGSAEEEIKQNNKAVATKSTAKKKPIQREAETSSSPEPPETETMVTKAKENPATPEKPPVSTPKATPAEPEKPPAPTPKKAPVDPAKKRTASGATLR